MAAPSMTGAVMAMVEGARAEVASLQQAGTLLAQDQSPQTQAVLRDLYTRLNQANVILAKADTSIERIRAISANARLPAHAPTSVPPAQRARLALSVLQAAGGRGVSVSANGRQGRNGKRPREDEGAYGAQNGRAVRPKLEGTASAITKADPPKPSPLPGTSVIELEVDGDEKGRESLPADDRTGTSSSSAKDDAGKDAALLAVAKSPAAKDMAPLIPSALDAVIARAAVETGLDISRGEGNFSVVFRCADVYCARLWLTRSSPSGEALPGADVDALYPDDAVVGAAINGIPERWGVVNFAVFQLMGERARAAMRYYWSQHGCVARALLDFAYWLASHSDLFRRTCEGRRLAFDASRGIYMPPCIRAFSSPSEVRFPRGCIPVKQTSSSTGGAAAAAAAAAPSGTSKRSSGQQARQHLSTSQVAQLRQQQQQQILAQRQQHLLQQQQLRQAQQLLELQQQPNPS